MASGCQALTTALQGAGTRRHGRHPQGFSAPVQLQWGQSTVASDVKGLSWTQVL